MNPVVLAYSSLAGAIICEVIGTTFLQKSAQFTKLGPTVAMVALYAVSFYLLSQALKGMPLGIAYAMWGGLGIILTALISVFVFKQSLDPAAMTGIGLIVAGVIVMNAFSNSVTHG
ncbi:multidrug efflux SMR transporter [Rhizobium daejeonense]|uniref:Multidrug efflux SMR transporter n=1 Tax=Rhizobium daejeonense TaxID=240521 RepID=A0A6M1S8Y0_9HYPH|nr:multidrug efflux SMR transporter [Rhizobium daejeonense]NGO63156.1 multidrug efflux SMR transporter [Rhizobium daejeonense]